MEDQDTLRKAMGLSDLDSNDIIIKQKQKDCDERKKLQDLVLKTNIGEKPEGPDLWAVDRVAATENQQKCNVQVTVVQVSAVIPRGNGDGTDITDIPKEFFIPMKLSGEWSIEQLFYSNSKPDKKHSGLNIAAPTNIYGYQDYWTHVPNKIRNAIPTFKQKFLTQYAGGYTPGLLKLEHISVVFYSFKCNMKLCDQDDITDHLEEVHGVKGGVTKLQPCREITVNANLPFEIQKLGEIEHYGEDKKMETIRSILVNCQSRDVISKTFDESEAYLREERSKDFMISLGNACGEIFFSRVQEFIREKTNKDVTESFSCKWLVIKEAILNAVGREHSIAKVDSFIDRDGTDFHGAPLDICFSRISHYVDSVCNTNTGTFKDSKDRVLSEYTFATKWKYTLIIRLVRSLPSTFASIKEHLRQEAADIFLSIKLLKDIGDFIKELKTFFTANGQLQKFTTEVVPAPSKKPLSANTSGVDDKAKVEDPEKQKKFSEIFMKTKIDIGTEKKFKKDLIGEMSKICNDSNASSQIGKLQEFQDFCTKNNKQVCFCCMSVNCYLKRKASIEAKMKKKIYNKNCSKKQLTLGEVKAMSQRKDNPKPNEGTSTGATATIYGPGEESPDALVDLCDSEEEDATLNYNMAEVSEIVTETYGITQEILQTRFHYWSSKDPKEMKSDKSCIICHKRNMNWPRYASHLEDHSLDMMIDSPVFMSLQDVIDVKKDWEEEEKPSRNPRYYDSVNDEELSEFESAPNESSDEDEPVKLIKIERTESKSSSSSDSSSDSENRHSDSSVKSKMGKSRQQINKRIKDVSKQCDTMNENIGNFEGRLVGIECNVNNISEDVESLKKMHKSGISAMKNIVETEAKTAEENMSDLRIKLEKSQEMSRDLDIKLCKSQIMQKESSDELKKLQKESSDELKKLQKESSDELKKLQKESSNEISTLKKDISDLMNFLKNEIKPPCDKTKSVENDNNSLVSTSDLYIAPTVMTSQASSIITMDPTSKKRTLKEGQSEKLTQSNPTLQTSNTLNINNFSFSAAQVSTMDQSQLSGKPLMSSIKIEENQVSKSEDIHVIDVEKDKNVSVEESKEVQEISMVDIKEDKGVPVEESKETQEISMDGVKEDKVVSVEESKEVQKISMVGAIKDISTNESKESKDESISKVFINRSFEAFTNVSNNTFNMFMAILKFQPGILYMVMLLLIMLVGGCRASPIQDQDNSLSPNAFTRIQVDNEMILFDVTSFNTKDFLYDLGEVNKGIQTGINSSCAAISAMNKQCALHPENCQAANLAILNLESSIGKYIQTNYALRRVCDAGEIHSSKEIIRRCQAGETWESQARGKRFIHPRAVPSSTITPEEDFLSSEDRLDPDDLVERFRRFVISTAILIATAFGVASLVTAAGTAAIVSHEQAQKVLKKVQNNRDEDIKNSIINDKFVLGLVQDSGADLDGLRETTTLSTHAQTELNQAISLENKFSHLVSRSGTIEFSDPSQETFMQAIIEMNSRDNEGLTRGEIGQKTRVSADITTVTTFVIPTVPSATKCERRMILKTLFVPIINHKSRRVVVMEGGKMFNKFGDRSRYILMSPSSFLSKQTKLFESRARIIGRSCSIHVSVNATVSPAPNPLFEDYHFKLKGNLTVTETCPSNTSNPSKQWTISSDTKLRLPLGCSLKSTLINCNSIPIQSGDSQVVHFSNHRMQIIEQHWNEEKLNFNETVFARSRVDVSDQDDSPSLLESLDTFKIPIIGSGGAVAIMIILVIVIIAAVKCQKESTPASTPVIVQTTATTSPVVSATATASPVVNTAAPSACPPPSYESSQATLDPEKIKRISALDRSAKQIDILHRYSMRKPPPPASD